MVRAILDAFPGAVVKTKREREMIDPTDHEIEAIISASDPAGEYLDALGKTDLATMTRDEWYSFIEVVVSGYQDALRALKCEPIADSDIPY